MKGRDTMGQTIQIRRGLEQNLPTLNNGEIALTTDTKDVYIGTPTGNELVGGKSISSQLADIAINVKTHGAKGDGVTDDLLAINTALTKGSTLFFPSGEYIVSSDIVLTSTKYMYGDNATITFQNGKSLIVNNPATISKLRFKSNTAIMEGTKGVITVNAKATIINCEIDGLTPITTNAITSNGGFGLVLGDNSSGSVISNNYIHNIMNGLIEGFHNRNTNTQPQLSDIIIENNTIQDSESGDGIGIYAKNSKIINNKMTGKWQNGFVIHPANVNGNWIENLEIKGNYINAMTGTIRTTGIGYAIALRYGDDGLSACRLCTISSNVIQGWGDSGHGHDAITIDDYCEDNLVDGNRIYGDELPGNSNGIRIIGKRTKIINNYIDMRNGGSYCVQLYSKSTDNILQNNTLISNGRPIITSLSNVGVFHLKNNIIKSLTSAGTIDLVDGCVVENNTIYIVSGGINVKSNNIISNNVIECLDANALSISGLNNVIQNNKLSGGNDGVYVSSSATNAMITDNEININQSSPTKRDSILISGAKDITIKNNRIYSYGRYPIQITASCIGDIVLIGNEIKSGVPTFGGSATYILYLNQNIGHGNTFNITTLAGTTKAYGNINCNITYPGGHNITVV